MDDVLEMEFGGCWVFVVYDLEDVDLEWLCVGEVLFELVLYGYMYC